MLPLTSVLTQDQESRLNPVPLPMDSNPDGYPQIQSLVGMLNDQSDPIVLVSPGYQAFDKWDAKELTKNHEEVGEGQNEDITSNESTEFPR